MKNNTDLSAKPGLTLSQAWVHYFADNAVDSSFKESAPKSTSPDNLIISTFNKNQFIETIL